jgi:hypothetical protein
MAMLTDESINNNELTSSISGTSIITTTRPEIPTDEQLEAAVHYLHVIRKFPFGAAVRQALLCAQYAVKGTLTEYYRSCAVDFRRLNDVLYCGEHNLADYVDWDRLTRDQMASYDFDHSVFEFKGEAWVAAMATSGRWDSNEVETY